MKGFFHKQDPQSKKATKRSSCFACGLYKHARFPKMEPYGNFKKKIMVLGEAPGEFEDRNGKPWQGKTGRLLQHTLEKIGIDLFDDCVCLNSVNCRPPNNRTPNAKEIKCCRDVKVDPALSEYKPKMVLLLGGPALTSFLGHRWKSSQLGGITKWAGWRIPDQEFNAWVCPTFHPSYVQRMEEEVNIVWQQQLLNAIEFINLPVPPHKEPRIKYLPDNDLSFLDEIDFDFDYVAFDYETTGLKPQSKGHRIVCCSIAYTENDVVSFMMPQKKSKQEPFIRFLKDKRIKKIASNLKYEDQWSRVILGTEVQGWWHDTMLMSHVLDHRTGTTGLKFQTYVNFGILGYDEEVGPYLKSKNGGTNSINRIDELLERPGGKESLMKYCALDSIYEYRLAMKQRTWLD